MNLKIISLLQQLLIWGHLLLVVGVAVRVLLRRSPPAVSLSWLLLLVILPYAGVVIYLLFGERFLGVQHKKRKTLLNQAYQAAIDNSRFDKIQWQDHHPASQGLAKLQFNTSHIAPVGGNQIDFFASAGEIIRAMVAAIDGAQVRCHIEFYIWNPGGIADDVLHAVVRAAKRNVRCRIMLDAVGSGDFFRSPQFQHLQQPNIQVVRACPIGFIPWRLARYDLRNHRKTLIVDDAVAFMGSFNLIDPSLFKREAGVGEWVDLMARIEGPCAQALDRIFLWYWRIETDSHEPLNLEFNSQSMDPALIQLAPSGPDATKTNILVTLLQGIYAAQSEILIVTPYFVPGEALAMALRVAAGRGVQVKVMVPRRVDSFLVRYASRAYFLDLLEAGVEILQFDGGLLHSKFIVVDRQIAFFGTVNLDSRSLWLNFEMTAIMYDQKAANALVGVMEDYCRQCRHIDIAQWRQRPVTKRLFENTVHLFSPLI